MRAGGLTAWLVAFTMVAPLAVAGTVTKIRDNGPDENRVVLVLVSDGYMADQEALFEADAERAVAGYFAEPPLDRYAGHFNVYTDFVASNESGADKPAACYGSDTLRDTAFDATFCSRGIRRLVTVNTSTVFAEVNAVVPSWDVIGVIVNDAEYGGAGGSVLTFTTHSSSVELFLHEAGHTFARLADEYEGDSGVGSVAPEPNVTSAAGLDDLKWAPWVDPDTPVPTPPDPPWTGAVTGAFEGARYYSQGLFRPWHSCKMRDLGAPFGDVCGEAHVQNVHRRVSVLDARSPEERVIWLDPCGEAIDFEVTPLQPDPPTVAVSWTLDGEPLGVEGSRLTLAPADLPAVSNEVAATLVDETELVRRAYLSPMRAVASWTVVRDAPAGDADGDGIDDACELDDDDDGVPDVEDCAPQIPAPEPAPPEVERLDVAREGASTAVLTWTDVAASDPVPLARHRVLTGRLEDLRRDRGFDAACRLLERVEPRALDEADPPAGGRWYVVVAVDACGLGETGHGGLPGDAPDC